MFLVKKLSEDIWYVIIKTSYPILIYCSFILSVLPLIPSFFHHSVLPIKALVLPRFKSNLFQAFRLYLNWPKAQSYLYQHQFLRFHPIIHFLASLNYPQQFSLYQRCKLDFSQWFRNCLLHQVARVLVDLYQMDSLILLLQS